MAWSPLAQGKNNLFDFRLTDDEFVALETALNACPVHGHRRRLLLFLAAALHTLQIMIIIHNVLHRNTLQTVL